MNNPLCRNEILEPGQFVNAYQSFHWGGKLIGTAKLIRRVGDSSNQTWEVNYISGTGYSWHQYTTTTPEPITPIIDH